MKIKRGTTHVTMFSSGAGSWAAARRVQDTRVQPGDEHFLVFADVKGNNPSPHAGEDEDNYRFLKEAAADIDGAELIWLNEGRDIWQVFHDKRFLGNSRQANCSHLLKQKPSRDWLEANCDPAHTVVYVGIDWTETHRVPAIVKNYLPYRAEAPLTEPPYVSKSDILCDLIERGIDPPRLYEMGAAHANCGMFCVRAGQGQFKQLLELMPDRYAYHEEREQHLREYLGKDVAILKDRRGGTTKPMTLRAFRERLESERTDGLELDDIGGCGCFVDGTGGEVIAL